jgi:hypothetical protein
MTVSPSLAEAAASLYQIPMTNCPDQSVQRVEWPGVIPDVMIDLVYLPCTVTNWLSRHFS